MKLKSTLRVSLFPLLVLVCTPAQNIGSDLQLTNAPEQPRIVEGYGRLPLAFEANRGQTDAQVKFLSRGQGYTLFLTSNEAVLTLGEVSRQQLMPRRAQSYRPARQENPSVIRMKPLGMSTKVKVTGEDGVPGKSNYFLGNDPKKWHTEVPQYAKVRYANIYPGVDLVYYGNQRELEYDFVLQPGADPQVIHFAVEGAQNLHIENGDLILTSGAAHIHLRSPHIYQEVNGVQHEIDGVYTIKGKNEVGFTVASYDRSTTLTIDPVLSYSSYLGGSNDDLGYRIALDWAGNAYVTGWTSSTDFPVAAGIEDTYRGGVDTFVSKINADGTALVYSTYLGGVADDQGFGIAVDHAGNAYLTGDTGSSDFPMVNAIQPMKQGVYDAFVAKIDVAGSALVFSTYLGGSSNEDGFGIAVDSAGDVIVVGSTGSVDFPTAKPLQPTNHGLVNIFITKLFADGSGFVYSTYFGGSQQDVARSVAVDSSANVYITGYTQSADFPTVNALQPTKPGGYDAFVAKISADGSAVVYSTYLGGTLADFGLAIVVDLAGQAYVTGYTTSGDFPVLNALQSTNHGGQTGWDAFVTKIDDSGTSVVYSTYLGGSRDDAGYGIDVDAGGNAYVIGNTYSADFPVANAIQSSNKGLADVFVTKINADGAALLYSTYLGGAKFDEGYGIAVDGQSAAYVVGYTNSMHFPTTPLAFQSVLKAPRKTGGFDTFVAKIASQTFVNVSQLKFGFATTPIGSTSAQKKFTLTNRGLGALTINKLYLAGKDTGDFAETNTCPATLVAGGTCNILVRFTPTAKNKRQAVIAVSDSDPASPQAIQVWGSGTVVSLSANKLAFGKQSVASSRSQNVNLSNLGNSQLNFTGISIAGMYAADYSQTNNCGTSIAAGASCTIIVTFKPRAIGSLTAALNINDDGGGSPQRVVLSGIGI